MTLSFSFRFFNKEVFKDTKNPRWQNVISLIQIRNRITHPKQMVDLQISEHEVKISNSAQDWLRTAFQSLFVSPESIAKIKKTISDKSKKTKTRKTKKGRTKTAI
jgi:hypothetical protein